MSTLRILFEPTPPHPHAGALRLLFAIISGFWLGIGFLCGLPWILGWLLP